MPAQRADRPAHALTSSAGAGEQRGETLACLLPFAGARAARRRPARNDARTTSRASSTDASSPSAIACTSRLPDDVASSGPASDGQPRRARRPRAEQLVARAAADDVQLRAAPTPVASRSSSTACACLSARLSSTQRTTAAGGLRRGLAGLARRTSRIRAGMSPGLRRTTASSGRRTTAARARRRRARRARRTSTRGPRRAQARRHSCSSQRPVTLRRSRVRPGDAALVRQVGGEGLVVDQRLRRARRRRATTCRR